MLNEIVCVKESYDSSDSVSVHPNVGTESRGKAYKGNSFHHNECHYPNSPHLTQQVKGFDRLLELSGLSKADLRPKSGAASVILH